MKGTRKNIIRWHIKKIRPSREPDKARVSRTRAHQQTVCDDMDLVPLGPEEGSQLSGTGGLAGAREAAQLNERHVMGVTVCCEK